MKKQTLPTINTVFLHHQPILESLIENRLITIHDIEEMKNVDKQLKKMLNQQYYRELVDKHLRGTRICFVPPQDWENVYIHYWQRDEKGSEKLQTKWPGIKMKRHAKLHTKSNRNTWYCTALPKQDDKLGVVFNNGKGEQTADILLDQSLGRFGILVLLETDRNTFKSVKRPCQGNNTCLATSTIYFNEFGDKVMAELFAKLFMDGLVKGGTLTNIYPDQLKLSSLLYKNLTDAEKREYQEKAREYNRKYPPKFSSRGRSAWQVFSPLKHFPTIPTSVVLNSLRNEDALLADFRSHIKTIDDIFTLSPFDDLLKKVVRADAIHFVRMKTKDVYDTLLDLYVPWKLEMKETFAKSQNLNEPRLQILEEPGSRRERARRVVHKGYKTDPETGSGLCKELDNQMYKDELFALATRLRLEPTTKMTKKDLCNLIADFVEEVESYEQSNLDLFTQQPKSVSRS